VPSAATPRPVHSSAPALGPLQAQESQQQ